MVVHIIYHEERDSECESQRRSEDESTSIQATYGIDVRPGVALHHDVDQILE